MSKKQPIRMAVRELSDPKTGEMVGAMVPATKQDRDELRRRQIRVGQWLKCDISQPRNGGFWGLAHKFGEVVAMNVPSFSGMDPHAVLKRLQIESGVECDYTAILIDPVAECVAAFIGQKAGQHMESVVNIAFDVVRGQVFEQRVARSLSFDSMDEVRFQNVMHALAQWVADRYWPDCSAGEIERMADVYAWEAA